MSVVSFFVLFVVVRTAYRFLCRLHPNEKLFWAVGHYACIISLFWEVQMPIWFSFGFAIYLFYQEYANVRI